jgi:hypothetical protein
MIMITVMAAPRSRPFMMRAVIVTDAVVAAGVITSTMRCVTPSKERP